MPTSFRPYDPDQCLLFPGSPREWLPEGHLAFFVADTIEELDLSEFYAPFEGDGRRARPFEPRMMLKVMVYAYSVGVFSSRKMARRLEEDVAFRFLAAGNSPSHRAICDFRHRHLKAFHGLFVQIVRIAMEAGVVKLGTLAIDGSKVQANASKHKAMSYGRMCAEEKRLKKQIRERMSRAEDIDSKEDDEYGKDNRGDELPEDLRNEKTRLERIRAAKKALEDRQKQQDEAKGRHKDDDQKPQGGKGGSRYKQPFGIPEDKSQINFTDSESRIMRQGAGFLQGYNAQIAVDEHAQLVVATKVTNQASDAPHLIPMLDEIESNLGERPTSLLADAGYRSEANLIELERRDIDGYVALGRGEKKAKRKPNSATCRRMEEKLATQEGKECYAKRKHVVEPPFGWIKDVLGFRRFSLRGLEGAAGEWDLVSLALNVKRLNGMIAWG